MPAEHDQIPEAALAWTRAGKRAALATVVDTWGSAPRPKGAQLAISAEAEMVGSVSGGCVEGAVVAEALDALADGRPRLLDYGVSDAEAFAVGLACGGRIRVLVEPVGVGQGPSPDLLERLTAARARARAGGLCRAPRGLAAPAGRGAGRPALAGGRGGARRRPVGLRGDWFLGVHNPPLRMAVVGAVHIAQALVPMARLAGYDLAVIDPREAFASAARFPDTTLSHDWPDEALAAFGLDTRTAVVTLTHDPKLDDPAIAAALRAPVFYLGCLGSHAHACEAGGAAEGGRLRRRRDRPHPCADRRRHRREVSCRDRHRHSRPDHRAAAAAGDAALRCASRAFSPPRPKARCWRIRWPARAFD